MAEIITEGKAPSASSQPSRKGKRAWRRNIDLSNVEQGLNDLTTELIAHGGVLAEKEADELFVADTVGDEELAKKERGGRKPLKAEQILAVRSAVPGLEGKARKRKAHADVEELVKSTNGKRAKDASYVSHRRLQQLRRVADGQREDVVEEENVDHDPWAVREEVQDPRLNFLDANVIKKQEKREPKTLKHPPIALSSNGKRIPHVPIPDAGKSYNPLVGDWSALLQREGAAAVEAEKARLHAKAEVENREARAAAEAAIVEASEKKEDVEAYATDYDSAWESEWDGIVSGAEDGGGTVWTQKMKGRKTPAERNKVKARKEREAKEVHEKKMKLRQKQEERIEQIAREASSKDKARAAHARALASKFDSSDSEDGVQLARQRFGKVAIPEASVEVVLPEELEDSLRRLKPEGNLLKDRYRNFLINGKMEVRKRIGQRKQPKSTRTEKWSYKDWKLR